MANSSNVVKVVNYSSKHNKTRPWISNDYLINLWTGTAFFIKKNLLLTAYHVVSNSGTDFYIFVSNARKYRCKIVKSNYELDLALITIIDDINKVDKKVSPLKIAKSSYINEELTAIGYSGDYKSISKIKCSISRLEKIQLTSISKSLIFTVTPTLHQGASGGPVINKFGEVVGLMAKIDNCSYGGLIPFFHINNFLKSDKFYTEIPFSWQPLINKNLIRRFGDGILILSDWKKLKESNVITHIDGIKIQNGVVPARKFINFESDAVLTFKYVMSLKSDHTLTLSNKKKVKIKLPYHKFINYKSEKYLIYGGLIFMPITNILIADKKLYDLSDNIGMPIIVDMVMTKNIFGYHSFMYKIPTQIGGFNIKSYDEFVKVINLELSRSPKSLSKKDDVLIFFGYDKRIMILNRLEAIKDTKMVKEEYL